MSAKQLSEEMLNDYKEKIQNEINETISLIKSINESIKNMSQQRADISTADPDGHSASGSSTDYIERQVYLLGREKEKLDKLNDSLTRIANKTYGICKICGEHIPHARLKIVPYAFLCITCKSKEEMRHRN